MSLKKVSSKKSKPAEPEVGEKKEASGKVVELTMYQRYYRGGFLYEQEKAYLVSESLAGELFKETENGRPVWRLAHESKKPLVVLSNVEIEEVKISDSYLDLDPGDEVSEHLKSLDGESEENPGKDSDQNESADGEGVSV